jgi:transposase-like protein
MPAPYPLEFRREAVELLKRSGKSVPQLAGLISNEVMHRVERELDLEDELLEI